MNISKYDSQKLKQNQEKSQEKPSQIKKKKRLVRYQDDIEEQELAEPKIQQKNIQIKENFDLKDAGYERLKYVDPEKERKGKLDHYLSKEQVSKKTPKKTQEEQFDYSCNISSSQKETFPLAPDYEKGWGSDNGFDWDSQEINLDNLNQLDLTRQQINNKNIEVQQQQNLDYMSKFEYRQPSPPQCKINQSMQEEQEKKVIEKKSLQITKQASPLEQKNSLKKIMLNVLINKPKVEQEQKQKIIKQETTKQNSFFNQPNKEQRADLLQQQEKPQKIIQPIQLKDKTPIVNTSTSINYQQKNQLWTQKYCPSKFSECAFNDDVNKKLLEWLANWGKEEENYGTLKAQWPSQNKAAKAVLLSGPPGIGKTTISRIVANHFGYNVLEWNASDIRSKGAIEENVFHLTENKTLNSQAQDLKLSNKTLIIMDEVDGMTGNDRGGIKAVIDMVKTTQIPIICICNDRYCQKIKSLVNHCYDIQFKQPKVDQIFKMLKNICQKEGVSSNDTILKKRIEQSQGDIRQLLTMLQVSKIQNRQSDLGFLGDKDNSVQINIFDATKMLLSNDIIRDYQKSQDLFFIDQEIIPLLCFENYLHISVKQCSSFNIQQKKDAQNLINDIANATMAFCESDIMNKKIRINNQWGLLPQVGFLSSMYPAQKIQGVFKKKVEFTQHLGRFSTIRKNERLLLELKQTMARTTFNCKGQGIKYKYLETLASQFTQKVHGKNMEEAVAILNNYELSLAHLNENITNLLSYFPKRIILKDVDTQTKTKLTKSFNQKQDSSYQGGFVKKKKEQAKIENQSKIYNENIEDVAPVQNEDEAPAQNEDQTHALIQNENEEESREQSECLSMGQIMDQNDERKNQINKRNKKGKNNKKQFRK